MRTLLIILSVLFSFSVASGQSLIGSIESLDVQERIAREHGFSYFDTPRWIPRFVELEILLPVRPNTYFDLHEVSYPYARPATKLFVERLARQYYTACGQKLVVTSLTRPQNLQPTNASVRSVHPTGAAVDFRYPQQGKCRTWIERVLLELEAKKLVEATRERYPPHYHIVVDSAPYLEYTKGKL